MPRLIPTISIGVSRKVGDRQITVFPPIGEMFEFTAEEVKQIRAERSEGLRRPINEEARASEVTSEDEAPEEEETVEHDVPAQPQPLTPQQQRIAAREAAAREAAARRHGGRRTNEEEEL